MTGSDDDLRRRVERLEGIQAELQALMRESTLMIARLNETLVELKQELIKMRDGDLKDLTKMKVSLAIVQWIGGSIGATGVGMIVVYLFKQPS